MHLQHQTGDAALACNVICDERHAVGTNAASVGAYVASVRTQVIPIISFEVHTAHLISSEPRATQPTLTVRRPAELGCPDGWSTALHRV